MARWYPQSTRALITTPAMLIRMPIAWFARFEEAKNYALPRSRDPSPRACEREPNGTRAEATFHAGSKDVLALLWQSEPECDLGSSSSSDYTKALCKSQAGSFCASWLLHVDVQLTFSSRVSPQEVFLPGRCVVRGFNITVGPAAATILSSPQDTGTMRFASGRIAVLLGLLDGYQVNAAPRPQTTGPPAGANPSSNACATASSSAAQVAKDPQGKDWLRPPPNCTE